MRVDLPAQLGPTMRFSPDEKSKLAVPSFWKFLVVRERIMKAPVRPRRSRRGLDWKAIGYLLVTVEMAQDERRQLKDALPGQLQNLDLK